MFFFVSNLVPINYFVVLQHLNTFFFVQEILPGSPWFTQDWDYVGFSRATSSPRNQILGSQGFVGLTSVKMIQLWMVQV